jgi:intraflagellar transport protein 122
VRRPAARRRYIKVAGGPEGREGLLVGTKGGGVLQVFVDNPFPVALVQHGAPVRCLDISAGRTQVAVVDDASMLSLYDIASKVGACLVRPARQRRQPVPQAT